MRPVAGAVVELTTGPDAGRTTTTSDSGAFSLSVAVDDNTQLRASKTGYETGVTQILPICQGCTNGRWAYFYLNVLEPPLDIAGDYTLAFTAADTCSMLPNDLRTRSYDVTIEPWNIGWPGYPDRASTSLKVVPRGGVFPNGLNGFFINVAGRYLNLSIGDHTDTGLAEIVAPDTYYSYNGWAALTVDGPDATLSTTFQGSVDACVNPQMGSRYSCEPSASVKLARCSSSQHRLSLTRR
jgi:hypothetical protein